MALNLQPKKQLKLGAEMSLPSTTGWSPQTSPAASSIGVDLQSQIDSHPANQEAVPQTAASLDWHMRNDPDPRPTTPSYTPSSVNPTFSPEEMKQREVIPSQVVPEEKAPPDSIKGFIDQLKVDVNGGSTEDQIAEAYPEFGGNTEIIKQLSTDLKGGATMEEIVKAYPEMFNTEGLDQETTEQSQPEETGWTGVKVPRYKPFDSKELEGASNTITGNAKFAANVVGGVANIAGDVVNMGLHPIDTAVGGYELIDGMTDIAAGKAETANSKKAKEAFNEVVIKKYGSWEGFQKAFLEDPALIVGDITTIVSGGAMGATKLSQVQKASIANKMRKAGVTGEMASVASRAESLANISKIDKRINFLKKVEKGANTINPYVAVPVAMIKGGGAVLGKSGEVASSISQGSSNLYDRAIANIEPSKRAGYQANPYQKNLAEDLIARVESPEGVEDIRNVQEEHITQIADEVVAAVEGKRTSMTEDAPIYQKIKDQPTMNDAGSVLKALENVIIEAGARINSKGKVVKDPSIESTTLTSSDLQKLTDLYEGVAANTRKQGGKLSNAEILATRKNIDNLINYDKLASSDKGQSALRNARRGVDKYAKDTIPGLKEIDADFVDKLNDFKDATRDLIYKGGDTKGDFRSNLHAIISNLNTPNRANLLARLEEIMPGVGHRVQAVRNLAEIHKSYVKTNVKGAYVNPISGSVAGATAGGAIGGMPGAIAGFFLGGATGVVGEAVLRTLKTSRLKKILGELSPTGVATLKDIIERQNRNEKIKASDKKRLEDIESQINAAATGKATSTTPPNPVKTPIGSTSSTPSTGKAGTSPQTGASQWIYDIVAKSNKGDNLGKTPVPANVSIVEAKRLAPKGWTVREGKGEGNHANPGLKEIVIDPTDVRKTTAHHEVTHAVLDGLPVKQQAAIFDEGRKYWEKKSGKKMTDADIEEAIAEQTAYYFENRKFLESTLPGQIKLFIQDAWNRVKGIVGRDSKIKNLYDDIMTGKHQQELKSEFGKNKDSLPSKKETIYIYYHAAPKSAVENILKNGFNTKDVYAFDNLLTAKMYVGSKGGGKPGKTGINRSLIEDWDIIQINSKEKLQKGNNHIPLNRDNIEAVRLEENPKNSISLKRLKDNDLNNRKKFQNTDPLAREAKKYDTVDEFIESNKEDQFFHATTYTGETLIKKDGFKSNLGERSKGFTKGKGVWLYKDFSHAWDFSEGERFGSEGGTVLPAYVKGKIYDATGGFEPLLTKYNEGGFPIGSGTTYKDITGLAGDKDFIAKLKAEGYVGINSIENLYQKKGKIIPRRTTFIFDENAIKTKQQLENIYKENRSEKKFQSADPLSKSNPNNKLAPLSLKDSRYTGKLVREQFDIDKLKRIGAGSGRDVYDLGNEKILKVVATPGGLFQTRVHDIKLQEAGIIPKVYEYGKNYAVVEKVPLPETLVEEKIIEKFNNDMKYIEENFSSWSSLEVQKILKKWNMKALEELSFKHFAFDELYDVEGNVGIRNGKPVIIDEGSIGLGENLHELTYKQEERLRDLSTTYKKAHSINDTFRRYQSTTPLTPEEKRSYTTEEARSLIEEARKHKSVDEFIKTQNITKKGYVRLYRGLGSEFDPDYELTNSDAPIGYSTWTDNPELARQYGENIYKIDLPKNQQGKELLSIDGDRVLFLDNEKKAELNNISGKKFLLYNYHELYNSESVKKLLSESQLTKIYNQAHKIPDGNLLKKKKQLNIGVSKSK